MSTWERKDMYTGSNLCVNFKNLIRKVIKKISVENHAGII